VGSTEAPFSGIGRKEKMNKRFFAFPTMSRQKLGGTVLFAAGIICAGVAQMILILAFEQPGFWKIGNWLSSPGISSSPLPGLLLYTLSGWMFIRGLSIVGQTPTQLSISTAAIQPSPSAPRFGFWITCLGLAALTAYFAAVPSANLVGPALAITWLINIALLSVSVLIAIRWRPPAFQKINAWFHAHLLELLGITVILSAAFIIRFWNIELHPYSFINDEGQTGLVGICAIQGDCKNLFAMGWSQKPVLAFVPAGISVAILGHTATAVRLVSVITGTLAVLAVYIITKEVFGRNEAWVAMALLATLPVHVHFSRLGVDNIADSLSTTVILGLLFRGMKRGSALNYLAAGILGGLCMYTYPGSRLAPLLGVGAIGLIALQRRGFLKAQLQNIMFFVSALIVTIAPIAGFFFANPNLFAAQMGAKGFFHNQAFQNALQSGESAPVILINQFMRSSLVFILTSAPSSFYNSPKPYLTPLAAIVFVLGFCYTIWRIKEERYLVLFVWFWAAIILGSAMTGGPPSSQRMLTSTPALAIITAIGICKVIETIPQMGKLTRWLQILALSIFVALIGYANVSFYNGDYRVEHFFENPTNEFTYETAAIISPLHNTGRLYIMAEPGAPFLSFSNFDYFSPDVEKASLDEVTPQSLANLQKDKDVLFIARPTRLSDLQKLAVLIPGGEWSEVRRRYQPDKVLYYSYKIKKTDLQMFKPQTQ
jgi:predicted membrane-bound mannosyltransferase